MLRRLSSRTRFTTTRATFALFLSYVSCHNHPPPFLLSGMLRLIYIPSLGSTRRTARAQQHDLPHDHEACENAMAINNPDHVIAYPHGSTRSPPIPCRSMSRVLSCYDVDDSGSKSLCALLLYVYLTICKHLSNPSVHVQACDLPVCIY